MADRFHINSELAPGLVVVRGPEAHHLAAVCRVRPGDAVCLFNGDGKEYPGRVVEVARRDVTVEILSVEAVSREPPFPLHLAVPLPKGDPAQVSVEKLTELGAASLTVLITERSVIQPREAKRDRLEHYVVEASKQCGRNTLMRVEPPRSWMDFIRDAALPARRLLAHPGGTGEIRAENTPVVAAVGPEGGFTAEETARALAAGSRAVDLGSRILRVETAALALAVRLGMG